MFLEVNRGTKEKAAGQGFVKNKNIKANEYMKQKKGAKKQARTRAFRAWTYGQGATQRKA